MEIRKAIIDDADQVFDLLCELKGGLFGRANFDKIFKQDLDEANAYVLVATEDSRLIGYLAGCIEDRLGHDKKVATVKGLVVTLDYRNRGIGRQLINTFEKIAKEHDCGKIEVYSNIERKDAHRFYTEMAGMAKTHYRFGKKF